MTLNCLCRTAKPNPECVRQVAFRLAPAGSGQEKGRRPLDVCDRSRRPDGGRLHDPEEATPVRNTISSGDRESVDLRGEAQVDSHVPIRQGPCDGRPPSRFTAPNIRPVPGNGGPDDVVMRGGRTYWTGMTAMTENVDLSPVAILAGIGSLDRRSLCALIAALEEAGMVSVAAEAIRLPAGKLGIEIRQMAEAASEAADTLSASDQEDHALRHRLWRRINDSLNVKDVAPLSQGNRV